MSKEKENSKQSQPLTLTELKAMAYDAISQIEYWQMRLKEINLEIQKKQSEETK